MAYDSVEELPNEVRQKLPHDAQKIFMTAFNGASSDGMSDEAATKLAWNTVKNSYEEGSDGQWHRSDKEFLEADRGKAVSDWTVTG